MIEALEEIAAEVGRAVLPLYESGLYARQTKDDLSPVTEADILADKIIAAGLRRFSNYPILSEEIQPIAQKASPERFWVIDPIDGTKEFIQKRPSFTINIALVEAGIPVAGVVFAPALGEMFAGTLAGGLRFNGTPFLAPAWPDEPTLVCSRSHPEDELQAFMHREGITRSLPIGSSLKFCWVAFGKAQYYPRFRSLASWDTAAGHAVALAGQCEIFSMETGLPFLYSFEQLRTPPFCVLAPGIRLRSPLQLA